MSAGDSAAAVFAYGSLVSRASIERTLGASVGSITPAELHGWRRGFTQARRNREVEKTFARPDTGKIPEWVLGLNVEPAPDAWLNGALIELDEAARERLDLREMRYERRNVSADVRVNRADPPFGAVYTYTARPENHAESAPEGAVILRSYVAAVESAFEALGPSELARYHETTKIPAAIEVIDAELVHDAIPSGNPRTW